MKTYRSISSKIDCRKVLEDELRDDTTEINCIFKCNNTMQIDLEESIKYFIEIDIENVNAEWENDT